MPEKDHSSRKQQPSFAALQKIIEQIHYHSDYAKLTEMIPVIICQHAGVNRCIYYTVQDRKLRLISAYSTHNVHWKKEIATHQSQLVSIDGHSPEAQVVRTGKAVVTNNPRKELVTPIDQWVFQDVSAYISIPILSQGKVVGLLVCLYTELKKEIDEKDRQFLTLFGTILGCAIHTTSVLGRMSRKEDELAALNKLSQMLSNGKRLSEILPVLARETAKTLQAKICIIRYLEGEEMILGSVVGMEPDELSDRFPAKVGLSGWMVKERKILVVKDLTTDPRIDNRVLIFSREQGLRSFIGAPLYFRDKLVGLIAIYTTTPRYFTNEEKELLSHFATEAALAIELTK
ncbi:MAG: GAF domain-containing protein [bacterium]|nr:GAF domain-containing protein [bacterium]